MLAEELILHVFSNRNVNFVFCSCILSCRYFQSNSKADDGCRKYSSAIPAFLQKRPRCFLKACLKQWKAAKTIPPEHIKHLEDSCGIFHVQSTPSSSSSPLVVNLMKPECSCKIWERSALPCRHILAILIHQEGWTWDKLPKSYTESPYLTIDYDFVHKIASQNHVGVIPREENQDGSSDLAEVESVAAVAALEAMSTGSRQSQATSEVPSTDPDPVDGSNINSAFPESATPFLTD